MNTFLLTNLVKIRNQLQITDTDLFLDLPSFGGFFNRGIFSAVGQGLAIALALLVIVWIGFSIYGTFNIISSLGDTQKIEKGLKTIKSVWIGITYFLAFFAVVSLLTVFIGVGAPWDWAENLQQCANGGPAAGRFYFQGKVQTGPNGGSRRVSYLEQLKAYKKSTGTVGVFCCESNGQQYIDVQYGTNPPSGCTLNSTIK